MSLLRSLCVALLIFSLQESAAGPLPKAPSFTLPDLNGTPVSLSAYRGRVVLIHFWATWCIPCIKEMPEIDSALKADQSHAFDVIAINTGDTPDPVKSFMKTHHLSLKVLLDEDWKVAEQYDIIGLPVTLLLDTHGDIVKVIQGGILTQGRILALIGQLTGVHGVP